jgi:hypothetical protein
LRHHPEERLGPYLEGELAPKDRRVVELHLASCETCSQALRELRTTVELLRLVPEPLAPAELGRAVMERVAAREHQPLAQWRARLAAALGSPLPTALGALAATALVVLTLRVVPSGAPPVRSSLAPGILREGARIAEPRAPALDLVDRASHPPLRAASVRAATPPGLPAPFRLRTERSGGMGVGAAAPGGSEILPPRPALARCQGFGRGTLESAGFDCRPWLAGMLTLAQFDPQEFLGEVGLLPQDERDAWLGELVGFAARSGLATRVVAGLRSFVDPGSALLAERFERGIRTAAVE